MGLGRSIDLTNTEERASYFVGVFTLSSIIGSSKLLDLRYGAAGDSLKVSIKTGTSMKHFLQLFFAFRPLSHHGSALAFKVGLHVRKLLDDGIDSMPEARTGKVFIDCLHLGALSLRRPLAARDIDQRLPQSDCKGESKAELGHLDLIDEVEAIDTFRQYI